MDTDQLLDASIARAYCQYHEYLNQSPWNYIRVLRAVSKLMSDQPDLSEAQAICEVMRAMQDSLPDDHTTDPPRTG